MKKWVWFFVFSSTYAFCYTPFLETILGEMAQNCIAGTAYFQATKSSNEAKAFMSLTLKNASLFSAEMQKENDGSHNDDDLIALHFLSQLLRCPIGNDAIILHLKNYLVNASIDIKKISHYLFENEPVFIIGAAPNDLSSPQLWIEKKNFVPVKEIDNKRTTVFSKWTTINGLGTKKFPSLITTTEEEKFLSIALSEKISW